MNTHTRMRNTKLNPDAKERRKPSENYTAKPVKQSENDGKKILTNTVLRYQHDPAAFRGFLSIVYACWQNLTPTQKIFVGIIVAAVLGYSAYFIYQFIMQNNITLKNESKFPSNRLTPEQQKRANNLMKNKTRFDPQFWKHVHDDSQAPKELSSRAVYFKERNDYLKRMELFKEKVEKMLVDNVATTQLQLKMLEQPDFTIDITHQFGVAAGSGSEVAGFNIQNGRPRIVFAEKPNVTPLTLTFSWLNEAHHGVINMLNRLMGCVEDNDVLGSMPYCSDGKLDTQFGSTLYDQLNKGVNRAKSLYELSEKVHQGIALTAEENDFYKNGVDSLKNYHPHLEFMRIPKAVYEKHMKPFLKPWSGSKEFDFILPKEHLQKKYPLPILVDFYLNITKTENDFIEFQQQVGMKGDTRQLISSFMTNINVQVTLTFSEAKNGLGYGKQKQELHTKAAELASSIDMLPAQTKQFIFKEACHYLSHYSGLDYCDYEDPRSYKVG